MSCECRHYFWLAVTPSLRTLFSGKTEILQPTTKISAVQDSVLLFPLCKWTDALCSVSSGTLNMRERVLISNCSTGNFRSAIAQSGSELAPWAVIKHWEHAWNNSRKFGEQMGCPTSSSDLLVHCLRYGRSETDLGNAGEFKV